MMTARQKRKNARRIKIYKKWAACLSFLPIPKNQRKKLRKKLRAKKWAPPEPREKT